MNHDEIADLLGAYALDAVDPHERDLVEAHLLTCVRCRAEVEDHRQAASLLAHTGGSAPDGLWERIASELAEPPPALRLVAQRPDPGPEPAPARRRVPRLAAAVAAAAAVVVAVLGVQVRQQDQRIDELQSALQDPLSPAFQAALEDPASEVIELVSADESVALRGVIAADGTGYLRASGLPELDADRTYQLWGAAGDQLVSLGVLGSSPDLVSFPAGGYEAFAITEEAAPGVVRSENQPLVVGPAD